MKKQLIGTTALVSAGLLAATGVTQGASAAEPLALSVGGYYQVSVEYRSEDDGTGEPGANLQDIGVYDDGEIQFTASTTLDNGIGVKARIEYEAKNQSGGAAIVDERYLEFSGGFGQLRIGSDDDAVYGMHYQAPVGAYQIGVNTTTFAVPAVGGAATSYPTTYLTGSGDAQKIIWFSPRISGFQLGLSYAPDGSTDENAVAQSDANPGGQEDIFSVGLNFVESFNDVDIAVSGGYLKGNLETTGSVIFGGAVTSGGLTTTTTPVAGQDDLEQWNAGLNIGFAGFTVGGSVMETNNATQSNGDTFTWDAGVTYSNGPVTVGITYLASEVETGPGTEDELDSFVVSSTYNLGPGIDVWGGLKWYDYQSDGASSNENDGWIFAVGSTVSF